MNILAFILSVAMALILLPLHAESTSDKLTNEFKVMLSSLEKKCSNYKNYYPYESAIKVLKEYKYVEKIPDYSYSTIFGANFLDSVNSNDCKLVAIDFVIDGSQWLSKNKVVIQTDSFWSVIQGSYAKALVNKFYLTGKIKLLDKSITILKHGYLERYTQNEYNNLDAKEKLDLKQSSEKSSFEYYEPRSYYLATMIFPPKIGTVVSSKNLEILLEKAQSFENQLIDAVDEPFDNYESATLIIFENLLGNYKNNQDKYLYWSQRAIEHIQSLQKRNYIAYGSCIHINNFSENLNFTETPFKKELLIWLGKFYKDNCNMIMPLDKFLKIFALRYKKDTFEDAGSLRKEIIRHASNDLWRYASHYKKPDLCEKIELNSKNNSTISIIISEKKYWQQFKLTYCKK